MDPEPSTNDLRRYFDELRGTEHAKNGLIEDLLARLDDKTQQYQKEKLDHARESYFNRDIQLRVSALEDELQTMKAMVERDAFVLVLIDGDGMIFEDRLIEQGEAGGKEAAGKLWAAVRDYVRSKMLGLSSDYKIVTRVYANLKGLSETCHRAGIIISPNIMEEFVRGFTGSKQLFDFIDVGSGKDRADDKICEMFKLHLYNCHCRHIIFGCSHDNGYARLLEDVAGQPVVGQITLLEGVPFERELANIKSKYETTKFDNLFRTSKINNYQHYHQTTQQTRPHPPQTSPQTPLGQQQMSHEISFQPPMARTTSLNGNSSMNPMATSWASWASTASAAPPTQVASPPLTPQPTPAKVTSIQRNKYGQRIDPIPQYDKSEMKRVQKIKMCNVHFLRQDCIYGDECDHTHSYRPNKNELATLRFVARQTPCRFGTGCDDPKCIYGHRCPAGAEGTKECRFGSLCRFGEEMHGVDTKVVKTTKV